MTNTQLSPQSQATTTMRAAWYERKGAAQDVIKYGEMELPPVNKGEVRVKIHVSGVNPSDTKGRSGWGGNNEMQFPQVIPHQDGAGVIESVGERVPTSRIGERVWIYEAQQRRPFGTAAEYVVVPATNAVRLPDNTDFDTGACLGVPAMTAHRCLFADGSIAGQTVLVSGGAGAVGLCAVQLAKWAGAKVITTVSKPEHAEVVNAVGADYVIKYKTEDVGARVKDITQGNGVDRIVEVAFGSNINLDQTILKPNGVISTYSAGAEPEPKLPFYPLMLNGITVHFVLVYVMPEAAHQAAVADINACLEAGALRPVIAKRFSLTEVAAAHDAVDSGQMIGKAIIEVI